MKKTVALGASVLVLSGCALPVPLQVASWALDGISVIATQKSLTDHGISMVAQKDCAVRRGIVDGELCREAPNEFMIANEALEPGKSLGFSADQAQTGEETIEELANFDTAAGAEEPAEAVDKPQVKKPRLSKPVPVKMSPVKNRTVVSLPIPPAKVRAVTTHALRAGRQRK